MYIVYNLYIDRRMYFPYKNIKNYSSSCNIINIQTTSQKLLCISIIVLPWMLFMVSIIILELILSQHIGTVKRGLLLQLVPEKPALKLPVLVKSNVFAIKCLVNLLSSAKKQYLRCNN